MTRSFFEAAGCNVFVTLIVATLWIVGLRRDFMLNLVITREALCMIRRRQGNNWSSPRTMRVPAAACPLTPGILVFTISSRLAHP